jgi:hypothetical protein
VLKIVTNWVGRKKEKKNGYFHYSQDPR